MLGEVALRSIYMFSANFEVFMNQPQNPELERDRSLDREEMRQHFGVILLRE